MPKPHPSTNAPSTAAWANLRVDGRVLVGDCLESLKSLPSNSIHAVVTDPPYGLSPLSPAQVTEVLVAWATGERAAMPTGKGFMGKSWDVFVPPPAVWDEVFRVLVPGGHVAAFAGSRTVDLMGISLRLAGFEMRDTIVWHYGEGFVKGPDVSVDIDKHLGTAGDRTFRAVNPASRPGDGPTSTGWRKPARPDKTNPASVEAAAWVGFGTNLRPGFEPICVARKPLIGTVALNVVTYGAGVINRGACAVGGPGGRQPANVVFTHSVGCAADACAAGCPSAILDSQSGFSRSVKGKPRSGKAGNGYGMTHTGAEYDDEGGASRFFPSVAWDPLADVASFQYVKKAKPTEKHAGTAHLTGDPANVAGNSHETVKPTALMAWLLKLFTPPGGTVLDPFLGSGSTAVAATQLGIDWIGCELTEAYLPIIEGRVRWAEAQQAASTATPPVALGQAVTAARGADQLDLFAAA